MPPLTQISSSADQRYLGVCTSTKFLMLQVDRVGTPHSHCRGDREAWGPVGGPSMQWPGHRADRTGLVYVGVRSLEVCEGQG